jgi:LysM repeat protein
LRRGVLKLLGFSLVSLVVFILCFQSVDAGVLSFLSTIINRTEASLPITKQSNSQTMALLSASLNSVDDGLGGNSIIIDNNSLVANSISSGEAFAPVNDQISVYVVKDGDTLSEVGQMFGVSINTIMLANDIKRSQSIKPGQTLVILPISGVRHMVKKGDTVDTIAKAYNGKVEEIIEYNGLSQGSSLAIGSEIIVPYGQVPQPIPPTVASTPRSSNQQSQTTIVSGYYIRPITGGVRTQGLHPTNAIDLASYRGAPIYASAGGQVSVSRSSGWNGGYGNYIVVDHPNGTQTLYAHLDSVLVSVGQQVSQGQTIGLMGSTGRTIGRTGVHLHFEIRGAPNPF